MSSFKVEVAALQIKIDGLQEDIDIKNDQCGKARDKFQNERDGYDDLKAAHEQSTGQIRLAREHLEQKIREKINSQRPDQPIGAADYNAIIQVRNKYVTRSSVILSFHVAIFRCVLASL